MASLKHCIKTLKKSGELSQSMAEQVLKTFDQHVRDGYGAEKAAAEAISDHLGELRSDLKGVYAQIGWVEAKAAAAKMDEAAKVVNEGGNPAATKEPVADRIDAAKRRLRAADTDEKRAEIEREIRALRQEAIADIQPGAAPQEQPAERAPRISMEQRAEMADQYGEAYARGFMAQRDGFSIEPASDIRSKADKEKFKDGWIAATDLATKEPAQGAEKVSAGTTATKERFEYPNPKYTSPSDLPAMRAVVDYMNGDITRDAMTQIIVDSGLPEGTIRSITNRLGEDSYSYGEIADIKRRQASAKEVGAGETANNNVAKEEKAVYAVNEPDKFTGDLFNHEIPEEGGDNLDRARKASAGNDGAQAAAVSVRSDPANPGAFTVTTNLVTVGKRKLPLNRVRTVEDAATVFAYLAKSAVEHYDALVTDRNGKPLAIIGSFKGQLTSTSVYPGVVAQELARIDGAATLWGAHNHPSGIAELSRADELLSNDFAKLLRGSGVEYAGLFAMSGTAGGKTRYSFYTQGGTTETGATDNTLPTKHSVPIVERELIDSGVRLGNVNTPNQAKTLVAEIAKDSPGILFMDAQNRAVSFVPFEPEAMGRLRTGGRLMKLFEAASKNNAGAAVIAMPDGKVTREQFLNLQGALKSMEIRVLDGVEYDSKSGAPGLSMAERGLDAGGPGNMFNSLEAPRKAKTQDETLIIQHNLSAENLLHAFKMGGIPVPSLAITEKGAKFDSFGEITLLGSRSMADPKGYANTKVFGADIYSPRYPRVTYKTTPEIRKRAEAMIQDGLDATNSRIEWENVASEGSRELASTPALRWKFLKEQGIEPKITRVEVKPLPPELQEFAGDQRHSFDLERDPAFIEAAYAAHEAELVKAYDGDKAAAKQEIADMRAKSEDRGISYLVRESARQVNQHNMDSVANGKVDRAATNRAMEAQIYDAGLRDAMDQYAADFLREVNPDEKLFKGYDYNGNRRYQPHTLENVVKILKKEIRGGEGFNYGVGSIRSAFTPQFRTIEQIRKASGRLMDKAGFEAVKEEIDTEFQGIWQSLPPFHSHGNEFGFGDTVSSMMYDAAKMGVPRSLKENGFSEVPVEQQKAIAEFLGKLRALPAEYFEAKILRDVDLAEFSGAVVPEGVNPKVIEALNARGIKDIRYYKKGEDSARAKAVESLADELHAAGKGTLFSLEDDQRSAVTRAIDRAIAQESDPQTDTKRGAGWLKIKLRQAQHKGEISAKAMAMVEYFIKQNPALAKDLAAMVEPSSGASGNYNPLTRIMTLFKGSASDTTAVHEILHHLERMMSAEMQAEIRKEWLRAATAELQKAQKAGDTKRAAYFEAVLAGDQKKATELLTGKGMEGFNAVEPAPTFKAVDTESAEFREWFGDWTKEDDERQGVSKVTDNGAPRVMYHASYRDFSEFDRLKSVEWRGHHSMDTVGSWFSDTAGAGGAGMYVGNSDGAVIYPVYLNIKNPKYYASFGEFLDDMHTAAGRRPDEQKPKGRGTTEDLRQKLKAQGYDGITFARTYTGKVNEKLTELISRIADAKDDEWAAKRADRAPLTRRRERLEREADSLRQKLRGNESTEFDNQKVYIAFDPTQIKSATSNTGAFSRTNPDIRQDLAIGQDYQYLNPSEFWAVRMTNTAQARFEAKSIWARSLQWLKEALEHIKGALGLKSDHPLLKALDGLIARGNGEFVSKEMLGSSEVYDSLTSQALDLADSLTGPSVKTLGSLNNVVTQLHKARNDPKHFGPIFNLAMAFRTDLSRSAYRSWEMAKDILPAYDDIRGAVKTLIQGRKGQKEIARAATMLFDGTTYGGGNPLSGMRWTHQQLKDKYQATAKEIELYDQARAAIDSSLTEVSNSIAWKLAKPHLAKSFKSEVINNADGAEDAILEALKLAKQSADEDGKATIDGAIKSVNALYEQAYRLKAAGYTPLSRFGRYTVDVFEVGQDGKIKRDIKGVPARLEFKKFDFEAEARAEEKRLKQQYADRSDVVIKRGVQGESRLFAGVDPETVALFVEQVSEIPGLDIKREVLDEWRREAVSQRSAITHNIKRKGIAGYSEDLPRVLAAFLTSNARYASANFHMADMLGAINDIPDSMGDVKDDATTLYQYINANNEPGAWMRGLMFAWYLGGSPAAAAVNMTQPVLMTLPYLQQFGNASKHLLSSVRQAMQPGLVPVSLRLPMTRAMEEGIVDAQEVHHLYAEGMKPIIARLPGGEGLRARAQSAATLWGAFFGMAENFNRRISFLAAHKMADEMGAEKLKAKGFDSSYAFARRAVEETQGIYAKENRPNWARGTGAFGAVGVAAFTFKQFSIQYVELLTRMYRAGPEGKAAAGLMLGLLILASGIQGVPGADDLDDLIDTIMQSFGYRGNVKKAKRDALKKLAGERMADIVMYGLSAETPIDVQARLGLGNMIPATGVFKPSEQNKAGQIAEILGPPGGMARSVGDFIDAAQSGQRGSAFAALSPVFVRNIAKAYQMADTGEYKDTRGRKVEDVDLADAAIKGFGFQPQGVASASRKAQMVRQDIAQVKDVESDIASVWAQGVNDKKPDEVSRARAMLKDWNEKNPETPIRINYSQILRRVREMKRERSDRLEKTAPREIRGYAREGLN